jgi:sialate O-acetylesterase
MSRPITLISILLLFSIACASAQITLPPLISDNMVLQQQSKVALWGRATANTKIKVITSWNNKSYTTTTNANGRWKVVVSTSKAGGPFEIKFSGDGTAAVSNVMIGEVWFCSGQSNMEFTFKGMGPTTQPVLNQPGREANIPSLRLFNVARQPAGSRREKVDGRWLPSTTEVATSFSALAYQFGKMLTDSLQVPVGIIVSAWGGARIEHWMSAESLQDFPEITIPPNIDTMKVPEKAATALFNGMVAPVLNYRIRGILWYQGESSRDQPVLYARLQPAMVASWRKEWRDKELPFYFVQIAPHAYPNDKHPLYGVLMREAQLKALPHIPNAAMAITLDVGSELKIHPPDKTTPALRLGYIALANVYGKKHIPWRSPEYRSVTFEAGKAILSFDYAPNGLISKGKELTNFEIAGEDRVFNPASARVLTGAKVEVWSEKVSKPVAVRYAFKNWVVGDLFNAEGLPASSFRTDNWHIPPFIFDKSQSPHVKR